MCAAQQMSVASPMVPGGMRNIHEGKVSGQTGTANHNPDRHGTQEYMNIVHQLGNEESDPSLRNASFPLRSPQSGCSPAGSDGTPKAGSRPPLILQSPPPYASPREGAGDQLGDKQQQQLKKVPTPMTPAAATATAVKDEKEMSDIVSSPFKDSTKLTLCLSRVKSSESDPPGELLPGLEHNSDLEGELAYQQVPVFEQNLGAKQQQQQQAGSSQWPGGALLSSSSPHAEAELNALAEIERIEHETANERECCSKEVQDKVLQGASSSGCDGVLENLTDYPVLKVELRCQHNTRGNAGKVTKNTSCAATMNLVLKRQFVSRGRKSKSQDVHIREGFLFKISLRNEHNHRLSCAEALKNRDVSQATCDKLQALFHHGHSPSSALDTLKFDLQEQEGENYIYASADRSVCPDLPFCYTLYYKLFNKAYGAASGEEMLNDLEKRLQEYNEEQGEGSAAMARTDDDQLVIAICTPLMKRVHSRIQQSGELVFVDSSGNCDRQNHRLFLLMTHSTAGGLPLGVLITTSENKATIIAALQLLNTILPAQRFFGHQEGPRVVMTDDCLALRQSLSAVYPRATLILCVFHLLQAMWRWLWNSHNGVAKNDRSSLMSSFRCIVYATTPSSLEDGYITLVQDPTAQKYPKFLQHLAEVFKRREEWAICLQSQLPTRGHHTNNFVESAMRVVKEKVFNRLKAYNITQMASFITTRMEEYYIRRLTDTNGRTVKQVKHIKPPKDVDCEAIVQEDHMNFIVPSSSGHEKYHVNMAIGYCSCPLGISGGTCKHQSAVATKFHVNDCFPRISTPAMRRLYYEIATGVDIPEDWFQTLALPRPPTDPTGISCGEGTSDVKEAMECTLSLPTPVLDSGNLTDGGSDANVVECPPNDSYSGSADTEPMDGGLATVETDSGTSGLVERLKQFTEHLEKKLIDDPSFQSPVAAFLSSFEKIKTDSALQSALVTFNKGSVVKTLRHSTPKGFLQTSTQIGVQPTAVARRKVALGGRRALITGRPTKASAKEHPYHRKGRKRSAPHHLTLCVEENMSLGGTH